MSLPAASGSGRGPDFEMPTYERQGGFGSFSMKEQRGSGRWTILFFYPADFTFV